MKNFKEYFNNELSVYKNNFLNLYFQTCLNFSEENVHDLRVSTRRLIAFSNIIFQISNSIYAKRLRKDLKKFLNSFGDLRDTQVQILKMQELNFEYPDFNFLIDLLKLRENKLINEQKKYLDSFNITEIEGELFFLSIDFKKVNEQFFDNDNFIELINSSSSNVNIAIKNIVFTNLDTVHSLRIALKKYRYISEILYKPLNIAKSKISIFKKQQNILGDIQDNSVFWDYLNLQGNNNPDKKFELDYLMSFLINERISLLKKLDNSIEKIKEL